MAFSINTMLADLLREPQTRLILQRYFGDAVNDELPAQVGQLSLAVACRYITGANPDTLTAIDTELRKLGEKAAPNKPHIVFVLSDQHNPHIAGYAGDAIVRTPNLEQLAARGVVLDNCYCASPLCVPSRSALLTGLSPHHTNIYTNFQSIPSEQPTFAHALALAGYETVLAGRMHFVGPDQRHGYMRRTVGDITLNTTGSGKDVYGPLLAGTSGQSITAMERSGPGSSAVLQYDAEVVNSACSILQEHGDTSEPLFLTVGLYGPHCPYVCPPELFDYYDQALPSLPPSDAFKATAHPAVRRWFENRRITEVDPVIEHRARAAYYGLVELMDQYLGRIYDTVAETLGLENTLFIYASDHGDMAGEHGLFWKSNHYEGSVRVPAIWSMPSYLPEGTRLSELTSLLDLAPTLINLADAPDLPCYDGENLWPALSGQQPARLDRTILSFCGDIKGDQPSAMVRKGPWKLVQHTGYESVQLFNLDDDPAETNDLGDDPALERIRTLLLAELWGVWDGETVREYTECIARSQKLISRFNRETGVLYPDEWYADINDNYIDAR